MILQLGQIDESECRVEGRRAARIIFPVSPSLFVRPEKEFPWGGGDSELAPDRLSLSVRREVGRERATSGWILNRGTVFSPLFTP